MTPEIITYPTQAEIEHAILRARQMRAAAFRAALRRGFGAATHWLAHPGLHLHHA